VCDIVIDFNVSFSNLDLRRQYYILDVTYLIFIHVLSFSIIYFCEDKIGLVFKLTPIFFKEVELFLLVCDSKGKFWYNDRNIEFIYFSFKVKTLINLNPCIALNIRVVMR
jgi:hypothetical protein